MGCGLDAALGRTGLMSIPNLLLVVSPGMVSAQDWGVFNAVFEGLGSALLAPKGCDIYNKD